MYCVSLIVALCAVCTLGFPGFREEIPNGFSVPNPCPKGDKIWQGVGHMNIAGGGDRSQFGTDYAQMGYSWNKKFCMTDSDGDGMTNGQELGDPNCEWKWTAKGIIKPKMAAQGHPGICDNPKNKMCKNKNSNANRACRLGTVG